MTILELLKKPHANSSANGISPNYRYSSMPGKTACYKHALSTALSSYFSTLIDENRNSPRHLFNTVARLTENHVDPCVSIPFSSNDFMNFFDDKIIKIRDTIQSSSTTTHVGSALPSTPMDAESSEGQVAHLNSFASIDLIEFNTIVNSSKSSTCSSRS